MDTTSSGVDGRSAGNGARAGTLPGSRVRNTLLASLPDDVRHDILGQCEPMFLESGHHISAPHQVDDVVFFPQGGLASVTMNADPQKLEVGIVGREGFVGLSTILQSDSSPTHTFVQVPGEFLRMRADHLTSAMSRHPAAMRKLLRYAQSYLVQLSSTAVANTGFTVEQRLARWLLMVHDRVGTDELALTHEFISYMLGARRPGVTVATHVLEGEGMIRAGRAKITILNRDKLTAFAAGSYGLAEAEYERLVGVALSASRPPAPQPAPGPSMTDRFSLLPSGSRT